MAYVDYFYLQTSDYDGLGTGTRHKFKAVAPMAMPERREQTLKKTVEGDLDGTFGAIHRSFRYTVRLKEEYYASEDSELGTLDDLRSYFRLNNPNATPSNVLTLTDHFGVEHDVWFMGEIDPQPMTTILTGGEAYYLVPIELQVIAKVA